VFFISSPPDPFHPKDKSGHKLVIAGIAVQSVRLYLNDTLNPIIKLLFSFFILQKSAIEIVKEKTPKNKLLEDYLTIFPDIEELNSISGNFTKEKFKDSLQPLITIASNNGFEFMY
jgi:hypothetical protein